MVMGEDKDIKINARTASASDFDAAAHSNANAFWIWAIVAGIVFYFLKWWSVIPALFAIWCAITSIGATRAASSLRKGTYRIPNPNNGIRDGK